MSVELAGSETFSVLEHCGHLIARDYLLEHGHIDVVTLHRLALLSSTQHVASVLKHVVEEADAGRILEVSKAESVRNALSLIHVVMNEIVEESLVEGHKDHFVASLNDVLDFLDAVHVDMKSLDGPAHVLVEEVHEHAHATRRDITLHFLELIARIFQVESQRACLFSFAHRIFVLFLSFGAL